MTYIIISASYANSESTAAVILTHEAGAVAISQIDTPELWADLHSSGMSIEPFPVPVPTLEEKIQAMDDAIKLRLNAKAVEMRFDNIASAIAAASLPVGEYRQADGAALHLWSARTWQKAEQIRDAFLAGERPEPTWTEVETELPTFPIEAE